MACLDPPEELIGLLVMQREKAKASVSHRAAVIIQKWFFRHVAKIQHKKRYEYDVWMENLRYQRNVILSAEQLEECLADEFKLDQVQTRSSCCTLVHD